MNYYLVARACLVRGLVDLFFYFYLAGPFNFGEEGHGVFRGDRVERGVGLLRGRSRLFARFRGVVKFVNGVGAFGHGTPFN